MLTDRDVEQHFDERHPTSNGVNGYTKNAAPTELNHLTDVGNAQRLIQRHGEDLRYCQQLGWLVWEGKHWLCDETGEVERRAKATVREIYNEAANCPDKDYREALASWAQKSESAVRIEAMISLAKSGPNVPIKQDQLNRHPCLHNVLNG